MQAAVEMRELVLLMRSEGKPASAVVTTTEPAVESHDTDADREQEEEESDDDDEEEEEERRDRGTRRSKGE